MTILLLLFSLLTYGQETTTFVLVRHAEKASDGTNDPALTIEGEKRAEKLAELFSKANITAIYSTNFERTKMTVAPLAKNKGLEIQMYDWKNPKSLLNKILDDNPGGTVVISGHSNTTPILANFLTGNSNLPNFSDDDYGNILIITTEKVGTGKLLTMRY